MLSHYINNPNNAEYKTSNKNPGTYFFNDACDGNFELNIFHGAFLIMKAKIIALNDE